MNAEISQSESQLIDELENAASADEAVVIEATLVDKPLVGEPCPACSAPRELGAKFCNSCGSPLATPIEDASGLATPAEQGREAENDESSKDLPSRTLHCQNCGSDVATSIDQRSYVCPFCDSSIVTEIDFRRSGRQRPEFIIGFAVTAAEAQQKYYDWLGKNAWFRPGDLSVKAVSEKQKGIYIPFWHFSMLAKSRWTARIGEYWYREERYTTVDSKGKTVTRTKKVRHTEWFPLRGEHQKFYHGYLVAASKGIAPKEAKAIQPFQLSALNRYRPFYLAGWMAEEYTMAMDLAMDKTKQEFQRRQREIVARFLPGDTHTDLAVQSEFDVNGSDLILLPVYVLSYRYRDRVYRFLVNGQTGKIVGEKPWSGRRIAAAVFLVVLLIAIFVVAFYLFAS